MDMSMPEMNGAEAIKLIKRQDARIKILALTTFDDSETVKNAMAAGCDGFILKAVAPGILKKAIFSIMDGISVFDESVVRKLREMAGNTEASRFTEREKIMLKMIGDGKTNHDIAERLGLSAGTVKNLITLLLNKTNTVSRSKLAAYAVENKII
jgi:DNA-binding NarL/FixJ family response regulator